MGEPARRRATYEELCAVPAPLVAEILFGALVPHPRPGPHMQRAASRLGGKIVDPFDSGRGGPGGWVILDEPEIHFADGDVLVPYLAGWPRERMSAFPETAWFELAPDWVCEVLSPSTESTDRAAKMPIYAGESVRHLWLADPRVRTLETYRLEGPRWTLLASYRDSARVRAEPFDAIELELETALDLVTRAATGRTLARGRTAMATLAAAITAASLAASGASCGRPGRTSGLVDVSREWPGKGGSASVDADSKQIVSMLTISDGGLEMTVDRDRPAASGSAAGAPQTGAFGSGSQGAEPGADPDGMRLVPAGPFTMGADKGGQEDEHPAHVVTLAAFWLDVLETTNADWDACVLAGACRVKSDRVRAEHPDFSGPNQPVSGVAWDDARAYCAWRGKRLPREAEYEKAVRDGDDRRFAWGNDPPTHDRTVFGSARPEDVGTHPAGRGPYGHDDLAGNVWEWMADEYDPYAYRRPRAGEGTPGSCADIRAAQNELRRKGQQGYTGSNPIPEECEHAIRGGAYNYDPDGLRATNRVHHPGGYRIPMLGVRCAKDAGGGK